MAEPTLADQSYGHFGQPVYDVHSKSWIFARNALNSWRYQPLGDVSKLLPGTKTLVDKSTLRKEAKNQNIRYGRALDKEIRRVIQGNPEIQAAEDILNPLLRASEAVIAATTNYDPAVGDVLAFGTAVVSDGQNRHIKARLLAIPGGECGEMLRLIRLKNEAYGWSEGGPRLQVPLPTSETGWWVGKGAPIQQICNPEILSQKTQGTFLAIRLPGSTFILRPRYRAALVPPAGVHLGCTVPPSRVDVNLLLEIAPGDWQGHQHADLAFNPWNQHQFGIVDHAGNWVIFRLQKVFKGSDVYKKDIIQRDSLQGVTEDSKETKGGNTALPQDGWARMLWVADQNTLLVCTRRHFQLFSLSRHTALPFATFLPNKQWILDARRCPTAPTWLFVLTSTQILWLEIMPEIDRGSDITAQVGRVMLSAHHFRDTNDISLQMHVKHDLDAISVLLWSRNGPLITCLRFDQQQAVNGLPSVIGVPTEVLLPIPQNAETSHTAAISTRRLGYETVPDGIITSSQPDINSLQIMTDDLSLHNAFLCRSSHLVSEAPRLLSGLSTNIRNTNAGVKGDDFVVANELTQKQPRVKHENTRPHRIKYAASRQGKRNHSEPEDIIDNDIIACKISGRSAPKNQQEIINLTTDLQNLVLDDEISGVGKPAKTLLEQRSLPSLNVGELAPAAQALSDLLSLSRPGFGTDEPGLAVKSLTIPSWATPMGVLSSDLDFVSLYNRIMDHQLAPLADDIAPRLRLRRERLSRIIAAEIILSSFRIEAVDSPVDLKDQGAASQDHQPSLPPYSDKGKARLANSIPASSQFSDFPSSHIIPNSSHSASRATSTITSTTSSTNPSALGTKLSSRLLRHVTFTPPKKWASRSLALPAHWDIGVDPSTYGYSQKLSDLEKQRQEESMSEKQREKARRKEERRLKRQGREAEKARAALMSSQPVVMGSQVRGGSRYGSQFSRSSQCVGLNYHGRSSPALPSSPRPMLEGSRNREKDRGGMSSQILAPPMVGSSQPPTFGRRIDGKAKRKKRKMEGF